MKTREDLYKSLDESKLNEIRCPVCFANLVRYEVGQKVSESKKLMSATTGSAQTYDESDAYFFSCGAVLRKGRQIKVRQYERDKVEPVLKFTTNCGELLNRWETLELGLLDCRELMGDIRNLTHKKLFDDFELLAEPVDELDSSIILLKDLIMCISDEEWLRLKEYYNDVPF